MRTNQTKLKTFYSKVLTWVREPSSILLLLIILLAIYLRFDNFPMRYVLGSDAGRDALVAYHSAQTFQLPISGPFSSLGPFTFGPWYYYQLSLFTFLVRIPFAPWVFMGLTSTAFVFVMYKIGVVISDKNFGLLLAFFTAISPMQIITANAPSNAWNVIIWSGLSVFLFLSILKHKPSKLRAFWFGICLGLAINAHYSALALMILMLSLVFKKLFQPQLILAAISGLLITAIPLLIFDLNTNWFTTRNLFYTYFHLTERIYVPNSWTIYLTDFWPDYLSQTIGVSPTLSVLLAVTSAVFICWQLFSRRTESSMAVLIATFTLMFVQLRYYDGERFISYLMYLQPFVLVFVTYPFYQLRKIKLLKPTQLPAVIIASLLIFPKSTTANITWPFEQLTHERSRQIINLYPSEKFKFYSCGDHNRYETQALMLLIHLNNKLSSDGIAVGLQNQHCSASEAGLVTSPSDKPIQGIKLSQDDQAFAEENGWKAISPESVYNETVRWWIKND